MAASSFGRPSHQTRLHCTCTAVLLNCAEWVELATREIFSRCCGSLFATALLDGSSSLSLVWLRIITLPLFHYFYSLSLSIFHFLSFIRLPFFLAALLCSCICCCCCPLFISVGRWQLIEFDIIVAVSAAIFSAETASIAVFPLPFPIFIVLATHTHFLYLYDQFIRALAHCVYSVYSLTDRPTTSERVNGSRFVSMFIFMPLFQGSLYFYFFFFHRTVFLWLWVFQWTGERWRVSY